jgi:O-methyltransferase involved in polyketide biosynthesis
VIATSGAQTTYGGQSPVATAATNAAATASPTGVASAVPAEQTLQQLDQELQQLGIDPQSLSLISRGGMLNWINDPAALRQIVQNVRSEANPQPQAAVIAVAKSAQNTASSSPQPAASANTNVVIQSAATAQQTAAAAMQFQKLEESLAPRGIQQASPAANPSGTATPQGQLLNVSA